MTRFSQTGRSSTRAYALAFLAAGVTLALPVYMAAGWLLPAAQAARSQAAAA